MNYCPLMSYAKQYAQEIPCLGEECALAADGAGNCLIKQALQLYVSSERTKLAEEEERIRRETELAKMYWAMKKDGTRTPFQFLQDDEGSVTPIQYAHQPIDAKHPHGGVYEDLTPLRDNHSSAAEVQLRPPAIDGSYINF